RMADMVDMLSKAMLWTTAAVLGYMVWRQARAKAEGKYGLPGGELPDLYQMAWALLLTSVVVAGLTVLVPAVQAGGISRPTPYPGVATSSSQVEGVPELKVQGMPEQRPVYGYGQWQVDGTVFVSDPKTIIRAMPGQKVTACLQQDPNGYWRASFIVPASSKDPCE
ncbi:MAG: hypothetical protein ACM3JD_03025, partial [Rudaea sp.]